MLQLAPRESLVTTIWGCRILGLCDPGQVIKYAPNDSPRAAFDDKVVLWGPRLWIPGASGRQIYSERFLENHL